MAEFSGHIFLGGKMTIGERSFGISDEIAHRAELVFPPVCAYSPYQPTELVRSARIFFGSGSHEYDKNSSPRKNNRFVAAAREGMTISFHPDGNVKVVKG